MKRFRHTDSWNSETLPSSALDDPITNHYKHHRSGAHYKPNEITMKPLTGQPLQSLQESMREEYETNRIENGETHLVDQLGGYKPVHGYDRIEEEKILKQQLMDHRLKYDVSVHRWKHIWLRVQYGTIDNVSAMINEKYDKMIDVMMIIIFLM
jgi:hypothetical protein